MGRSLGRYRDKSLLSLLISAQRKMNATLFDDTQLDVNCKEPSEEA